MVDQGCQNIRSLRSRKNGEVKISSHEISYPDFALISQDKEASAGDWITTTSGTRVHTFTLPITMGAPSPTASQVVGNVLSKQIRWLWA